MEMNLSDILFFTREFQLKQIDNFGNPSLFEIFNAFQEAAIPHAAILGFGNEFLKLHNLLFVICRMKIRFYHSFSRDETYQLVTFPLFPNKIQVYREAFILDSSKNRVADLTSLWVLIDKIHRRITLMTEMTNICNQYRDDMLKLPKLIQPSLPSLQINVPENNFSTNIYQVSKEDIDVNGHMNNAVYAKILDSLNYEKLMSSVEINFEKECFFNEKLFTKYYSIDNSKLIIGKKEDNSLSYKAKIVF